MNTTKESNTTLTNAEVPPAETTPPSSQYDADARAKIAALRAMAADFALPEPRSLTSAERRLVAGTSRVFVEKAANFGEIVPGISEAANADYSDMRDGEAYANAYDAFIDELESLRQLARKAVALRRLKSARSARSIYRVGKSHILVDGGDNAKTHVQEMKKALHRRRRAAEAQPPLPEPPTPTTPTNGNPA
jgi:hypothetical protein